MSNTGLTFRFYKCFKPTTSPEIWEKLKLTAAKKLIQHQMPGSHWTIVRAGPEHPPFFTNHSTSMQITEVNQAETRARKLEVFTNKWTMSSELDKWSEGQSWRVGQIFKKKKKKCRSLDRNCPSGWKLSWKQWAENNSSYWLHVRSWHFKADTLIHNSKPWELAAMVMKGDKKCCYRKGQGTENSPMLDYLHDPGNVQTERC